MIYDVLEKRFGREKAQELLNLFYDNWFTEWDLDNIKAMGFNWILLFEAYRYTTVSTATLCYYMAPIIVILVSPVLLREKLTAKKLVCVLAALLGMVGVSGVLQSGIPSAGELRGIVLGLSAAALWTAAAT